MPPRERNLRNLSNMLKESRRLARRKRRRLSPAAQAELAALHVATKEALASQDPARLEGAQRSLEDAFTRHLLPYRKSVLRLYAEVLVVAAVLALGFRTAILETYELASESMAPTLLPGDVVLVSKSAYGLKLPGGKVLGGSLPGRGDVVVYSNPLEPGKAVQRVVGLPGDTIEVSEKVLHVNGAPQPRHQLLGRFEYWSYRDGLDYWHPRTGTVWIEQLGDKRHATLSSRSAQAPSHADGPHVVPEGHVFVMGDNRDEAADGRSGGGWFLPMENIVGEVWIVALSWGPGGWSLWGEEGIRPDRLLRPLSKLVPGER